MGFVSDVVDTFTGKSGAEAAGQASDVQAAASQAGIEEQRRQFNITQANLSPFLQAGTGALGAQQALLGLSGAEAQETAFAGLQESPGQKFIRDRQQRALLRNSGAIGGLGGGNVRTALQEQAAGFASQDIQNQFGRLGQIAGQGQATGTSLGKFGAQAAGNIANLGIAGAEARASGIFGQQQAQAQGLSNITQLGGQLAGFFSDERLKYDVRKVDSDKDGGIYLFKYIGSKIEYIGRMAQDLMKTRPDAVSAHESGYYVVTQEFKPEPI